MIALAAAVLLLVGFRFRPAPAEPPPAPLEATPAAPAAEASPPEAEKPPTRIVMAPVDGDAPVKKSIAADEVHVYPVRVEAGKMLEVEVEQLGADVVLELVDESGELLFRTDMPSGPEGPESIYWLAASDRQVRVEVEPFGPGSYSIGMASGLVPDNARLAKKRALEQTQAAFDAENERRPVEETLPLLEAAESALRGVGDSYRLGMVLFFKARREWYDTRDIDQALETFEGAEDVFSSIAQARWLARTLNSKAVALREAGYTHVAERSYQESLALWQALGDRYRESITLSNLGDLLKSLGKTEDALELLDEALRRFSEYENEELLMLGHFHRGTLFALIGQPARALDDLREARRLAHRVDSSTMMSVIDIRLGDAEALRGDDRAALDWYREAMRVAKDANDRFGEAVALSRTGYVYYRARDYQKSVAVISSAIEELSALNSPQEEAACYLYLSRALARLGDAPSMALAIERAQETLRDDGATRGQINIYYMKSLLERLRGDLPTAIDWGRQAVAEVAHLRSATSGAALRSSLVAQFRVYYDNLVSLLMAMYSKTSDMRWAREALQVAESSKARSLMDSFGLGISLDDGEEIAEKLYRLREAEAKRELARLGSLTAEDAQVARLEKEVRRAALEFDRAILEAASGTESIGLEIPLSVEEALEQIGGDQPAILSFYLGEDEGYAWVISREAERAFFLEGRRFWYGQATRLQRLMSRSHLRRYAGAADLQLERVRVSLSEVMSDLPSRVLLIPDGPLTYVPFELLTSADGQSPLAAAERYVAFAPSLPAYLEIERRGDSRDPGRDVSVLAVGDPVFSRADPRVGLEASGRDAGRGLPRLPFSGLEIEAVEGAAKRASVRTLRDFEAARSIVLRELERDYDVVHLATHGRMDSAQPELSSVELSSVDESGEAVAGSLIAAEVSTSRFDSQMVVLSGCNTGLGVDILGEGLVGLTQSFLVAGADRVIVSRWAVDDRATATLMKAFYRALFDGVSPVAALAEAKARVSRVPGWSAPYYWAGYSLHGSWGEMAL